MKKHLLLMLFLAFCYFFILSPSTHAQTYTKIQGFAQEGGQKVVTQGLTSATSVQKSFPLCTITVFDTGTSTLAAIYSNSTGTPKSNPFTADSNGYWFFYGASGARFDVRFSGTGITTPFTIGDYQAPFGTFNSCSFASLSSAITAISATKIVMNTYIYPWSG